jgi:hypothetical protein
MIDPRERKSERKKKNTNKATRPRSIEQIGEA